MSAVAIYMEGGGDGKGTKAALRQGMDGFLGGLKDAARAKAWRWKLVPCGGRQRAYDTFSNACDHAGKNEIVILLVDAEGPVTASTPVEHLQARPGEGWDLAAVPEERIHLMVQTMETWIVADREALESYYGRYFEGNALPGTADLETVARNAVADALTQATRRTQKGRYHKVRHAADLLARIDPARARARCRHCARLFDALDAAITTG